MKLSELFSLHHDTDHEGTIALLSEGIDFRGTNLWLLILAMLVASIGLNTDSAAVIIGAMLISPLMGPIAGAGLALGIYDMSLLRRALVNLAIMTVIALLASTAYFMLSPIQTAGKELLARTSPSFFDVLIAFTGGAALTIASSRRTRSANTLAGVAIATALMPPLCAAGFGLARGNAAILGGALYLYLINSIFIGLAVFALSKYLGLPLREQGIEYRRKHILLSLAALAVFVAPSLWFAFDMSDRLGFESNAARFVSEAFVLEDSTVIKTEALRQGSQRIVRVTLAGKPLGAEAKETLERFLPRYQLQGATLELVQTEATAAPVATVPLVTKAESSTPLPLASLRSPEPTVPGRRVLMDQVGKELAVLAPELKLEWGTLGIFPERDIDPEADYRVVLKSARPVLPEEVLRLESWLRLRLGTERVSLVLR